MGHPASCSSEPIIDWFWSFVRGLEPEERCKLLCWVSGLRRMPHGGWSVVGERMTLRLMKPSDRLPSAHTCTLSIDVPRYKSKDVLEQKFRCAMEVTEFG